ncbi:hypothetical protein JOF41_002608 [Saccharothrix coeruleofusca]|nr:hypothetical protein [Saccharothrix coeruleofusca]
MRSPVLPPEPVRVYRPDRVGWGAEENTVTRLGL